MKKAVKTCFAQKEAVAPVVVQRVAALGVENSGEVAKIIMQMSVNDIRSLLLDSKFARCVRLYSPILASRSL